MWRFPWGFCRHNHLRDAKAKWILRRSDFCQTHLSMEIKNEFAPKPLKKTTVWVKPMPPKTEMCTKNSGFVSERWQVSLPCCVPFFVSFSEPQELNKYIVITWSCPRPWRKNISINLITRQSLNLYTGQKLERLSTLHQLTFIPCRTRYERYSKSENHPVVQWFLQPPAPEI